MMMVSVMVMMITATPGQVSCADIDEILRRPAVAT